MLTVTREFGLPVLMYCNLLIHIQTHGAQIHACINNNYAQSDPNIGQFRTFALSNSANV